MLIEHQYMHNRSLSVAVIGVPNAGKSSLINSFLGFDLTVVSHKAQTTRNRYQCVAHIDHTELIFTDTPGLHSNAQELNKRMNGQANEGLRGADVNLMIMDVSKDLFEQYQQITKNISEDLGETWLVFNKCDKLNDEQKAVLPDAFEKLKNMIPSLTRYFLVSVKDEDNLHELTGALLDKAPNSPHLYTDGAISNKNERFFVTEYIRERCIDLLKEELPYELAVIIDDFKDSMPRSESQERRCHISATIIVNRPSQRAIVVGGKGMMIKKIGTEAREKIEELLDAKVFLNLHVKVAPKWFKNNRILEEIGLPRVNESTRVWRTKND